MIPGKHFRIEKESNSESNIINLIGELDLSKAQEFKAAVDPLLQDKDRCLVLNLKELSYMDSTGLGVILSIIKTRHSIQAPLAVEDIPPKIQKLFDITGMTPFLTAVTNTVN